MAGEEERLLIQRQDRAHMLRDISLAAQAFVFLIILGQAIIGFLLLRSRFRAIEEGKTYLEQSRAYSESIVATISEPLLVVDTQFKVRSANRAYYLKFGGSPATLEGGDVRELGTGEWNDVVFIARVKAIFEVGGEVENFQN